MTNEELEEVIEYNEWMLRATLNDTRIIIKNHQLYPDTPLFLKMHAEETIKNSEMGLKLIEAARELLQLKDGTHPDMVMVQREQWQPIETYDYQNFPEVWLAAWIEPSEYAKENGVSSRWDIGIGRCWHVNTRKFTGVLGGTPTYWCKTNKPYSPAQKGKQNENT